MVGWAVPLLIARGLSRTPDCPILGPKWDSFIEVNPSTIWASPCRVEGSVKNPSISGGQNGTEMIPARRGLIAEALGERVLDRRCLEDLAEGEAQVAGLLGEGEQAVEGCRGGGAGGVTVAVAT